MATELCCPSCSGDLPVDGDERSGEQVFCPTCGAVCVLKGNADDADCALEEDF